MIVNGRAAAVVSTLPAASIARALNVYEPSARLLYVAGDVHDW
jgi:hypothetical protein